MMLPHWADKLFITRRVDSDEMIRALVASKKFEDVSLRSITRAVHEAILAYQSAEQTLDQMPRLIGLVPAQQARVRLLATIQFERELDKIEAQYVEEGYKVVKHPGRDELPGFAADFDPNLLAVRGDESILIAVKRTRDDVRSDPDLAKQAEVINAQPGRRFDLVVLESDTTDRGSLGPDPSAEQIEQMVHETDQTLANGPASAALVLAWGTLEASLRRTSPRPDSERSSTQTLTLVRELYAEGDLSEPDFRRLEATRTIRNAIVHGHPHPGVEPATVSFVLDLAKRLLAAPNLAAAV